MMMIKRLLPLVLLATAATATFAQHTLWVGGDMCVNSSRSTYDDQLNAKPSHITSKSNYYSLNPEMGLRLNDRWDLALKIGFGLRQTATETLVDGTEHFESNRTELRLIFNPYIRYRFATWEQLRFFVDGGINFGLPNQDPDRDDLAFEVGAGLYPGVSYPLGDRLSVVAHLGALTWSYTDVTGAPDNQHLSLELTDQLSLGFILKL